MFELATWGFWNCFIVSRKNGTVIHDYFWGIWCYCVPLELVVYSIFRQTQFEHWKKEGAAAVYSGNFGHLSSNSGDTIYTYVYSEYCITLYSMNMIYKYIYMYTYMFRGDMPIHTHIYIFIYISINTYNENTQYEGNSFWVRKLKRRSWSCGWWKYLGN